MKTVESSHSVLSIVFFNKISQDIISRQCIRDTNCGMII